MTKKSKIKMTNVQTLQYVETRDIMKDSKKCYVHMCIIC